MTAPTDRPAAQVLLQRYLAVLGELTDLAETEGTLLAHGRTPLPLSLVQRKERMVSAYAVFTAAVKERAQELAATRLLDPVDLETRIRRLVVLTKENQRRLNAGKERSVRRVEAVMGALGDPTQGADEAGSPALCTAGRPPRGARPGP